MTFRDERQAVAACRVLCQRAGLRQAFKDEGPTPRAVAWLEGREPLSGGERTVLRAAFAFWNGNEGASLADALRLDADRLADVASLLSAWNVGALAVDEWIQERDGTVIGTGRAGPYAVEVRTLGIAGFGALVRCDGMPPAGRAFTEALRAPSLSALENEGGRVHDREAGRGEELPQPAGSLFESAWRQAMDAAHRTLDLSS